jgi:hypothetical protein
MPIRANPAGRLAGQGDGGNIQAPQRSDCVPDDVGYSTRPAVVVDDGRFQSRLHG